MNRSMIFAAALAAGLSASAAAQAPPPVPAAPTQVRQAPANPLKAQADRLVAVLAGTAPAREIFSAGFLAQVPEAQVTAIAKQLRDQLGAAEHVAAVRMEGPYTASVDFGYARGTATMRMAIEPAAPHLISGLLVTGTTLAGDSFTALSADFRALPGASGFAAARLGGAAPAMLAEHNGARAFAIGSAFKLYVLAELMRQVKAGTGKWDQVVPLAERSLPSGILQDWPTSAPLTLHTLAALMISRSDNSAADRLISVLGRERVEAVQALAGHSQPARNRPFLTTNELFMLKGAGGKTMLERWTGGDAAARRTILAELAKYDRARFDYGSFTGPPKAIDTAEWFATPGDVVRLLDWIRLNDPSGIARGIMAINPGIGGGGDYAYLGYKGGSEAGVINLSFLVQTKAGAWVAVSGSWNDPKAAVDDTKFVALMSRAVALAAK